MKLKFDEYSLGELITKVNQSDLPSHLKDYATKALEFHTDPAPGLLISIFMVDYALELLGASPGQMLYATCETKKCAPDAIQVILQSTIGNNRLRIIPTGRFAMILNLPSDGPEVEGVRVYIDPKKLVKYPTILKWFTNDPAFDHKTMKKPLIDEILKSRRAILSSDRVRMVVPVKIKWRGVTCPHCGEMVPNNTLEGIQCQACGTKKFFQTVVDSNRAK